MGPSGAPFLPSPAWIELQRFRVSPLRPCSDIPLPGQAPATQTLLLPRHAKRLHKQAKAEERAGTPPARVRHPRLVETDLRPARKHRRAGAARLATKSAPRPPGSSGSAAEAVL